MIYLVGGVAFLVGAAAGAVVSHFVTKRICERNASITMANFVGFKEKEKQAQEVSEQKPTFPEKDIQKNEELVVSYKHDIRQPSYKDGDYHAYSDSEVDGGADFTEDELRGFPIEKFYKGDFRKPFEIDEDTFIEGLDGYSTHSVIFYLKDRILMEEGVIVRESFWDDMIGMEHINRLKYADQYMYIQNEEDKKLFEIEVVDEYYEG